MTVFKHKRIIHTNKAKCSRHIKSILVQKGRPLTYIYEKSLNLDLNEQDVKKTIIIMVVVATLAACQPQKPNGILGAEITSIEVTPSPDGLSAVFVATTNFNPSTVDYLAVGIDIWEGDSSPRRVWGGKNDSGFITRVDDLITDHTYSFYGFLKTEHGEILSPEQTFTTGSETQVNIPDFDWSIDDGLTAQSIITFADAALGDRLARAFDTNGDGALSVGEAAAVSSFKSVLGPDENFSSFDEFRFFTGIKSLGYEDRDHDYIAEYYDSGFRGWLRLTSIVLPSGLKEVGWAAFLECPSLKRVTIPEGLEAIRGCAFSNCTRLKNINFPQTLRQIEVESFWRCTSLQSINIPEGVEELPSTAFKECSALKSVKLPQSLKEIGQECFAGCTGLKSINLPSGLKTLGDFVFFGSGLVEVAVPEGINTIPYSCFMECRQLAKVTIPVSVMEIGGEAFSNCVALKDIKLPEGLMSIGPCCFYNTGISKIEIPSSVVNINGGAFSHCSSLNEFQCHPVDPPSLSNDIFEGAIPAIYVPSASLSAYRTAPVWSDYANKIQAIQ